ncbi:MAG: sialidase family protein [Gemmatimonadales bacterium]|jgi:hypothetical protein
MSDRSRLLPFLLAVTACSAASPTLGVGEVEFAGPPGSGEPHLTATADGRAVLTWLEPVAGERYALRFAVRDAAGWSEPRTIAARDDFFVNWADFPSLAVLTDGTWVTHWLQLAGPGTYAYHVKLAVSRDTGRTWSAPITPHRDRSLTEHGFVSVVAWRGGAMLVWLDGRQMREEGSGETGSSEGEMEVGDMSMRATTLDADGVRGRDVLLDGRTCECCQTALVRTANGLVAAYRDRSAEEIRDIAVVRYVDDGWTDPVHVANDGFEYPGCPVNGPQLSARGDTVAIAWYTAPRQEARVQAAFSTDGGATWGAPIPIDDGDPLGRVDVEFLADGTALVVWLERTAEAAEVRARRVSLDGGADDSWPVAVTGESRGSGFPRMSRVGSGVVVAYTLPGEEGGVRVVAVELSRGAGESE